MAVRREPARESEGSRDGGLPRPAVSVRGIYSTALARVLASLGYPAIDSGPATGGRVHLRPAGRQPIVSLFDRQDRQGVWLVGPRSETRSIYRALVSAIPGAIRVPGSGRPALVFNREAKRYLDGQRRQVMPTIQNHHLLQANGVRGVEQLESELAGSPEALWEAGGRLWEEAVSRSLRLGSPVKITHAKPWKHDIVATGYVVEFQDRLLTLERYFRGGGKYDTLDVPKREGDWGRMEVPAGGSVLRRTYFRADGTPLGELYNIQMAAEVGPRGVWYVDLEVDVACFRDGQVTVVDLEELDRLAASGAVDVDVTEGARRLAEQLADGLRNGEDWLQFGRQSLT
ncbi:MAG: DUF402 domain-containing protein [Chloroflexota bacterium]